MTCFSAKKGRETANGNHYRAMGVESGMEEINENGHRLVPLRKSSLPSTSYLNQSSKKNSMRKTVGSHFPDVSQSN